MSKLYWRMPCAMATAILASGCASLPLEQGRSSVQSLVRAHVPVAAAGDAMASDGAQTQVDAWLAAPLSLEQAQQVALLRNPALKAHYARLGLSAAEVFEAGRLQNPSLGISWLLPLGSADGSKLGASLMTSFADLLMRRARQRIAGAEFAAMQEQIAADTLEVMAATQRAWYACVAANQRLAVRRSIAEAARLAADLAQQYREAGNINALEHQVQRAEASQARIALQDAQMELADARAGLQKQMGLAAGQSRWTVPEVLPDMPAGDPPALEPLLAKVLDQRLDVSAARKQVQALRERRDAAHRYRLLADSRVGAALDREGDGAKRLGPSVELALPLFHQGQGEIARADAQLAAGEAQLAELEVAAHAELARQVSRIGLAREQVQAYREGLIPEREAVVARLVEQANFMLVDSFAVLMARQQEYAAYDGYVDAMLKFWNAQVDL
ncbi:MAG TPA: TolC family protein, partial [Steroidobacteraceae bacterium]|nr:TolC family protein [Steroidobacteraceae bacterium]